MTSKWRSEASQEGPREWFDGCDMSWLVSMGCLLRPSTEFFFFGGGEDPGRPETKDSLEDYEGDSCFGL